MYALKAMINFFDIIFNYMTLQLVRCAAVSVMIISVILLIRLFCRRTIFLKGLLWSLLLLSPLFGRLTVYYELNALSAVSWKWVNWCMNYHWIGWLYFAGIFIMTGLTVKNRYRLNRFVKKLSKIKVNGTSIYVCPARITPFTTGVFVHKIVIPEFMLEEYSDEELESVLIHEKTHIRLMHMFLFLIWDILNIILWINPLFTVSLRFFRQDMEDICDRVTIQKSGCDGYKYGSLLIKSLELLQNDADADYDKLLKTNIPATFTGEEQFLQIKQRIIRAADYKKYKKSAVCILMVASVLIITAFACMIGTHSYARYENDERIFIRSRDGKKLLVDDCKLLREIVSYDDDFIYVDTAALKSILEEEEIQVQTLTVSFGGYSKLPGYGGGGYCEFLEPEILKDDMAKIPYISRQDVLTKVFKYI